MPKEDLFQLASSGLPNLGGSFENPTWNRSLPELKVAGAQSGGLGVLDDFSISLLDTRRLPDLDSLRLGGCTLENSTQSKASAEADFLKWKEVNKRRELNILSSIVANARMVTSKKSQELHEKREVEDWEKKRELWTNELAGTRLLGGSYIDENLGTALLENDPAGATPLRPSSHGPDSQFNNNVGDVVDPQFIMFHLEIIKRESDRVGCEAANELAKAVDPCSAVYATALRMVSRILSRENSSPVEVALATLGHFSSQFDAWILGKIRKAGLEGKNQAKALTFCMHKNPNANTVASFVSLELGGTAETALWPCLYYCLRIGDAAAAKEVFECTPAANESNEVRAAICSILSSLAQRQGSAASLWEASSGSLVLGPAETRTLAEAFDMSKTSPDLYRAGVLSLLGGAGELPTATAPGFGTIEDYLFGFLWKALQNPNSVVELENVGKTILSFGSAYFDDQDSGGWSYALPLLAAQQFRTALSYLVHVGGAMGMLQATHLGILLESKGLKLENLGESSQPASGSLITSLLVDYSNWLHGYPSSGAVCSLEYLRRIPNKNVMMDQVSALILQTKDIPILAGSTSNDGKRGSGALDNYFLPEDVTLLLKQAAEKCFNDAKDREGRMRAAQLFMAAGDFRSVVIILSNLILPDINVENEEKRYWYEQSKGFVEAYLKQSSFVMGVLESNNHLDAVTTFKAMMSLYEYFSLTASGSFREAWSILDRLDILPQSKREIGEKTIRFKGLNPLLQQSVPSVMVATMQSFYREHTRLKTVLHSGAKSTTSSAMDELKEKAGVLLTFAGVISIGQEQMEEMGRIEAGMI